MEETFKDPPLVKLFRGCFQSCLPILNDKTLEGVPNEAVVQVPNDVNNDVSDKKSSFVQKKDIAVTSLQQCVEDLQNDEKMEKTAVEKPEKVCTEAMDSSEPDQIGEKNGEVVDEDDEEVDFEENSVNAKPAVTEPRLSSQSMSPTASDGESMLLEKDAHSELTNGMYDHRSEEEHMCTSRDDVDRDVCVKESLMSASSDNNTASNPRFSEALKKMESACRVFCEDVYGQLNKLGNPKEIDRRLQVLNLRQNSDLSEVDTAVWILERIVATVLLLDFFKFQGEPLLKDLSSYRRECLEEFERLSACYDESLLKTDVSRKEFKKLTVEYFRKHERFEGDVSFKQFTQDKNCALKESIEELIDDIPDLQKRENALHSVLGTDLSNKRITVHYLSLCKSVWRLRWFSQSMESATEIAEMTKAIHSAKL